MPMSKEGQPLNDLLQQLSASVSCTYSGPITHSSTQLVRYKSDTHLNYPLTLRKIFGFTAELELAGHAIVKIIEVWPL